MSAAEPTGRGAGARRAARSAGGPQPRRPRSSPRPSSTPSAGRAGRATAPSSSAGEGRPPGGRRLDPDALAALEEERDFLLRSIDDLEREHDAGDVDDHDFAALKDDYTARAAAVLRAIDEQRVLAASGPRRSWARTGLALAVVAVLAVGVGWLAFRDAGARAPGDGLSGDARQDSANLAMQAQALTGQARVALEDGDTDQALGLYRDALSSYSDALELAPANVDALTSRGWLYHNLALGVGEGPQADELDGYAREDLAAAVALDPSYGPARVFRAVLARDDGDAAAARAELAAADPSTIPSYMDGQLDDLRSSIDELEGAAPAS